MIKANQRECYEVSSLQEDLWRVFKDQAGGAFHSALCSWDGRFDRDEFSAAVGRVGARFDLLRSDFTCPARLKKPLQVVRGSDDGTSVILGPTNLWSNASIDVSNPGVDFAEGRLIAFTIDEGGNGGCRVRISLSALIGDRKSLREIVAAIAEEYDSGGSRPSLADDVQFAAVASYLNEVMVSPELQEEREYWDRKNRLLQNRVPSSFVQLLSTQGPRGRQIHSVQLAAAAVESLASLSVRLGSSPLATSLACWNIFLNRYFRREVSVAFLAEDRVDELAQVMGPLAKYLPFSVAGNTGLPEAVRQTEAILGEYAGRQELFRAPDDQPGPAFCFEFAVRPARSDGDGFGIQIVEEFGYIAPYETSLALSDDGGKLRGELRADAGIFSRADVERVAESFATVLTHFAAHPEASLEAVEVVGPKERRLLLETFGVSPKAFPAGVCLHDLFLHQAKASPDQIAVVAPGVDGADVELSFAELERRSGRLAAFLVEQCNVRANAPVALMYGRTVDMVVGILAVLRAGAAYVPLDPEYPDERVAYILQDSAAQVVLTVAACRPKFPSHLRSVATDTDEIESAGPSLLSRIATSEENLAYIIYTSGSTGRPKGVCVQHRAAVNLVHGLNEIVYRHYPTPVSVALVAPYVFDPSVQQIFASLTFGHRLCIVPDAARRDGVRLIEFYRKHDIRISDGTPMHIGIMAVVLETESDVSPVERLLIGGELLKWETVQRFFELRRSHGGKDVAIVNLYGPTECCVDSTFYEIAARNQPEGYGVPIGRPLPNIEAIVLDEKGLLVPVGVEGELYLGGTCLGAGYTHADETKKRFIAHPLGLPGKVYRTGDLVRWTRAGDLEFLGRNDRQIKFRGHRIELSEIETVFCRADPRVTAAVAHVHDLGDEHKALCCYLVGEGALDMDSLRAQAGKSLPDYMLPTFVSQIDAVPLTSNGKTDYARLPEPRKQTEALAGDGPRTPEEAVLAGIWREALNLEQVSLDLGFFQQGGDSIRSLMVRAKARKAGLVYSMDDFLNGANIRQLAVAASKSETAAHSGEESVPEYQLSAQDKLVLPADAVAAYPMSALQLGMVYHSEFDASSKTYIDYSTTRLDERFDEALFRQSLDLIFRRHPVLRTSLHLADFSEPMQVVHATVPLPFSCTDLRNVESQKQDQIVNRWFQEQIEEKFQLDRAPLIRFGVHLLGEEKFQLSWINHHAILDGWSMASLVTEIGEVGLALRNGTRPALAAEDWGHREFVALEKQASTSETHRAYWKGVLDRIRPAALNRWPLGSAIDRTGRLVTPLTPDSSQRLRAVARQLNLPLKSVLLSVHLRTLQILYGRNDVTTGLVFNGRPEKPGSERILGLFLNTLPLSNDESWDDTRELPQKIGNVYRQEREMEQFRRFPLSEIKKLQPDKSPLFETLFGYINFHVYQNLKGKVKNARDEFSADRFEENDFLLTTLFGVNVEDDELNLILKFDPRRISRLQVDAIKSTYLGVLDHFVTSFHDDGSSGGGDGSGVPLPDNQSTKAAAQAAPQPELHPIAVLPESPATPENNAIAAAIVETCRQLLHQDDIQLEDNFFQVGGDSITATILAARLRKRLGVKLSPRDIFDHPELHRLAGRLAGLAPAAVWTLPAVPRREHYPVSFAQQRMYVLHQYNPASLAYNLPRMMVAHGKLDVERLRDALQEVVNRHDILRTSYHREGSDVVQMVANGTAVEVSFHEEYGVDPQARLRQFVRPFDLAQPLQLRVEVVKFAPAAHYLFLDCHHIAFDRVSSDILWSEMLAVYRAKPLPAVLRQYQDYAVWQREVYERQEMRVAEAYWEDQYQEPLAPLVLPYDYPRPKVQEFAGGSVRFALPETLSRSLREVCHSYSITPNILFLSLFKLLLSGYSGQRDLAVGVSVLGRSQPELERVVGLFLSTVAIRLRSSVEMRFSDFLLLVRETMLQGLQHQDYPFENLAAKKGNYSDQSRNLIFDVMFVYQGEDDKTIAADALELDDLRCQVLDFEDDIAKCDLTLFAHDRPTGFTFSLNYATGLFRRETIENFRESFCGLCEGATRGHHQAIAAMPLLSATQRDRLLNVLSGPPGGQAPEPGTVIDWFERQAARQPDAPALHFHDESMTYGELNDQANRLARQLKLKHAIEAGTLVGVLLDHCSAVFVSVLAILKAGAAFVPLGLDIPAARNNRMLKKAGVRLLITRSDLIQASELELEKLEVDRVVLDEAPVSDPSRDLVAARLAYVIFTSGSTGEPKGVMIEHPSLSNYIGWASRAYVRGERCGFAFYSALNFDLTITSLFLPIVTGGTAVIFNEADLPRTFEAMLNDPRVDIMKATPTHLHVLRSFATKNSKIRRFIVGGEDLKSSLAKEITDKFSHPLEIYNEYGPTEGTVGCMVYRYTASDSGDSVPIGAAIDGVRLYVVDQDLNLVPFGVKGELCLGGVCLAKGYLNGGDTTSSRFVRSPFIEGEGLYRTGDYVRWIQGDRMLYLGRMDNQVKIRGYRIEVGEVEAALKSVGDFEFVAVRVVQVEDEPALVAYFTSCAPVDVSAVRDALRHLLPSYMLPNDFVELDGIPLTPNGKVDEAALPQPKRGTTSVDAPQPPDSPLEHALLGIWKCVLEVPDLGVTHNFFDAGGHSLKAMDAHAQIQAQLGCTIPFIYLFTYPTVRTLAQAIESEVDETDGDGGDGNDARTGRSIVDLLRSSLGRTNRKVRRDSID